jgi:hypothetical protein
MPTVAAPIRTTPRALRQRLLWPYVVVCAAAAVTAAWLSGTDAIAADPLLFAGIAAALIALDFVESDLLGGGHTTPTTAPSIALVLIFGPAGAVAAEALLSFRRLLRRPPPIRVVFDLGALSLAGIAAWAAVQPLPQDGFAVLLTGLVAGAAYVTVNSTLLTLVWALHEGRSPLALYRERLGGGLPHELAYGPLAMLLLVAEREMGGLALALVAVPLVALWLGESQAIRASTRSVTELREANERLRRMMQSTVESLARTIEARDPYTGGHTERVGEFAHRIAVRLGLGEDQLRAIAAGSVIHDIGKIGIPDAVLLKPGSLDESEWETMRRHPVIGAYILDELDLPEDVKAMVRHHHERFDGSGYPDGLAGEDIPLAARILTVADAIDAMTSDRPYREALSMEVAAAEMRDKAGTQFCPRVVAAAADVISGGMP